MYAPHFAAALAIKSRVRRAPLSALLIGAFLPDMVWIVLARLRVEPSQTYVFFDDWSHSFVSVLMLATVLASFFWRLDRVVALAAWWAVFSHFVLDFPVHPKQLALYPLAKVHLGWNLLPWGSSEGYFGFTKYWWLQSIVLLVLLVIYLTGMRKLGGRGDLIAASCVIVVAAHFLLLSPCLDY
jgi:hypothetical protein